MNKQHLHHDPLANLPVLQESRTSRFNLPIRHPAKWRFLLDQLLSSPMRLHRYRNLSARIFEDVIDEVDGGHCQ